MAPALPSDPLAPRIGALSLASPFLLAPMAGYTDGAFRRICEGFGAALTFTEMVNAEGVSANSPRTLSYLETLPGESAVAAHIYGSDPEGMGRCGARIRAMDRFTSIDINAGCPMPKIVRNGAGVALMKNPALVRAIVWSVCKGSGLPVTVKTRLGIRAGESRVAELGHAAADGGAGALIVHGRYAAARHGGDADWPEIVRVKQTSEIPVIGNGGATTADEAMRLLSMGLDGVMIGRAAIGRPWIFAEALALWRGEAYRPPTMEARYRTIDGHLRTLIETLGRDRAMRKRRRRARWSVESTACRIFRRHLIAYLAHAGRISSELRERLMGLESADAVMGEVERFLADCPSDS